MLDPGKAAAAIVVLENALRFANERVDEEEMKIRDPDPNMQPVNLNELARAMTLRSQILATIEWIKIEAGLQKEA